MTSRFESKVPSGVSRMSAAEYIARAWPLLGKQRVNRLADARQLKINGERAGGGASVSGGDELLFYLDGTYDTSLKIIFDDGGLMVFIKPRGLPTDADDRGIGEDTALTRLKKLNPDARLVHRLDAGTEGVMLAAANDETETLLNALFSRHLLTKQYSATVIGLMPQPRDELKAFLTKDAKNSLVSVSGKKRPGALEIVTSYIVKNSFSERGVDLSRLNIFIPTGRTHQIRAHLSFIGHPLLGDDKYGNRLINRRLGASETDLSCCEISFPELPEAGKYAGMRFITEK